MKKINIIIVIAIIALAAASRLVDHPANFTPIVAMSLFAGAQLKGKWGVFIPLAAMLASDYFLGFYHWPVMAAVYGSIALAYGVGKFLQLHQAWYTIVSASIISSVIFFVITNFVVWAGFNWYTHDVAGLAKCFTLAIPFFRNSLLGDLFYSGVLFGSYAFVVRLQGAQIFATHSNK